MDLLAHLAAFDAVAREENFTRAAERLDIPQPLLSRRIKNLEAYWGEPLLHRSARGASLSAFGTQLLPHVAEVLQRAHHLEAAVGLARSRMSHAVGLPPDCAPAAVARIIRAGVEDGLTLTVREVASGERARAFAAQELALALRRVPAEGASLRVALGVATEPGQGSAAGHTRRVHLDALRPRRGAARGRGHAVLVLAEDDVPEHVERLRRAVARAGLPDGAIRVAATSTAAAAEVLAEQAVLLCDRPLAGRLGLAWAALADVTLDRGYEIDVRPGALTVGAAALDRLRGLLCAAVGATRGGPDRAGPERDDRDRVALAASA